MSGRPGADRGRWGGVMGGTVGGSPDISSEVETAIPQNKGAAVVPAPFRIRSPPLASLSPSCSTTAGGLLRDPPGHPLDEALALGAENGLYLVLGHHALGGVDVHFTDELADVDRGVGGGSGGRGGDQ